MWQYLKVNDSRHPALCTTAQANAIAANVPHWPPMIPDACLGSKESARNRASRDFSLAIAIEELPDDISHGTTNRQPPISQHSTLVIVNDRNIITHLSS